MVCLGMTPLRYTVGLGLAGLVQLVAMGWIILHIFLYFWLVFDLGLVSHHVLVYCYTNDAVFGSSGVIHLALVNFYVPLLYTSGFFAFLLYTYNKSFVYI